MLFIIRENKVYAVFEEAKLKKIISEQKQTEFKSLLSFKKFNIQYHSFMSCFKYKDKLYKLETLVVNNEGLKQIKDFLLSWKQLKLELNII